MRRLQKPIQTYQFHIGAGLCQQNLLLNLPRNNMKQQHCKHVYMYIQCTSVKGDLCIKHIPQHRIEGKLHWAQQKFYRISFDLEMGTTKHLDVARDPT